MINKILEELDRMMDAQEREIEIDMETEDESKVYLETVRLLAYNEVARMIKKCAQEAASSMDTQMDINSLSPEKYNTDSGKSEIKELVCDILNIILSFLEDKKGFIKEAESCETVPDFKFEFSGTTSSLKVDLHQDGVSIFHLYKYLDGVFNLDEKKDAVETLEIARQNLVAILKEVEE